ncbi:thiol reductant ABC exporter subunit CydC [Pseudovibrio sp. SPO723]|uniref:thiol reductant ABC exporter subunit CydC n=1 Tax=Nesiotobacter zosterae TaxID=392721 RepID=UPI0029C5C8C3|nr:thiol reductant ABC exporter subunit CydC [Pseudovibrio sp. SPO723]MDX5592875.1 thiol reductant ABC exporter subunit CydC [Pseudovibrio sp. SPO723]
MRDILTIFGLIVRQEKRPFLTGLLLSYLVLIAGLALLGISGWFITATGAAGLVGIGIQFDVFRPSAAIRFLALGRAAARYGERMLTHDATLKSLTILRLQLLKAINRFSYSKIIGFRGGELLNRVTADVDALDGISLRLIIPILAGGLTYLTAFAALYLFVAPIVAWVTIGLFLLGTGLTLSIAMKLAKAPSNRIERAHQSLRLRLIDLFRSKTDLIVTGNLQAQLAKVGGADQRLRANQRHVDTIELVVGVALSSTSLIAAVMALALGADLAQAGSISAAQAALGFFAILALNETMGPLRRGVTEYGRMQAAASRVNRLLEQGPEQREQQPCASASAVGANASPALSFQDVHYTTESSAREILSGISFDLEQGQRLALTGPSGGGKSTVLHLAARLLQPTSGSITLFGAPLASLDEAELRARQAFLPQRSMLMHGTILDCLRLANPAISEAEAWELLKVVALERTIKERGGLSCALGESGLGLSGGQKRRLSLARVLARHPRLVLLDEPTEGLDQETANEVLAGISDYLPNSAILIASHRDAELNWAHSELRIRKNIFCN